TSGCVYVFISLCPPSVLPAAAVPIGCGSVTGSPSRRRHLEREASSMTLRRSRPHTSKRWFGVLAVAAGWSVMVLTAALGHTPVNAIPGNFFAVLDQQGANDVPGQVDLTQMGRDDSSATTYRLFWSWDSTDQWTGNGQTGDACALFDTDDDANINFVICVRINNPGADPSIVRISPNGAQPVFLFSCSDKKNDRCTNPAAVAYTSSEASAGGITTVPLDATANLITDTDPFGLVGTNEPHDSTVEIAILKTKIPGSEVLVNVCSYPSAGNGGNNNPFDCIVTPGTGFLKIVKVAGTDESTDFVFNLNPAPVPPASATQTITGNGDTGNLVAVIGNAYSVTETVPSGWTLSTAGCTIEAGGSTGTFASPAVTGITVASGRVTTCTFTNSPILPKLTVTKIVINDNGGNAQVGDFPLFVDATSVTSGVQNTFAAGSHTVSETGQPGYSATIGGDCAGDGTITLALGDVKSCTITNDDEAPTITLIKSVTNDNGGNAQPDEFALTLGGTGVLSGAATTVQANTPLAVDETLVDGYSFVSITGDPECPAVLGGTITADEGEDLTCTITNDDGPANPTGSTVQSWVLHDELFITGIRHGADDEGDATVTFRLWDTCDFDTGVGSDQVGTDEVIDLLLGDSAATVAGVLVLDSGTYYWTAQYSGDTFNNGFTTDCGDEITQILAKDAKDGGRDDFASGFLEFP
ncbi:MAG: prealbumin-like fold domain-containing protein, partial [Candidatus Limnocylindria bacterium]